MDIFIFQPVSRTTKLVMQVEEVLVRTETKYQKVLIGRLKEYGLSLVLDELLQVAEADEAFYHECLVHPALLSLENPESVLIIGGGDGCALREVLKHDVDEATLVDIDGELVELCKQYLRSINQNSLKDRRARIIIMDGKLFIEKQEKKYDCIISDLTDPYGPEISRELYSKKFFEKISTLLRHEGIFVTQAGSAFYYGEIYEEILRNAASVFKYVKGYEVWVPSFGYSCSFIIASNSKNIEDIREESIEKLIEKRKLKLRYYNASVHLSLLKRPVSRNPLTISNL